MKNKKLYVAVSMVILIVLFVQDYKETQKQTVVPGCFADEDCKEPIRPGYCDVEYECTVGRCFTRDVPCPETCGSGKDDDLDGFTDCDDPDCWNSPYCPCYTASFNACKSGHCWCPGVLKPKWVVEAGDGRCIC